MLCVGQAAQATEVSCWIPMLWGKRTILAGDHCQLPPTVKSDSAARDGLAVTIVDRVVRVVRGVGAPVWTVADVLAPALRWIHQSAKFGEVAVRMLTTQYRMNHLIADWSSHAMYHDKCVLGCVPLCVDSVV